MSRLPFSPRRLAAGFVLAAALLLPASAHAGWLSVRNDTKSPLVVQEVVIVNNVNRPGKLRQLFAGEVSLENVAAPCTRRIVIFDPRQPNVPLYRGDIACTGDDQFFAIQWDAPPRNSPRPPQIKLVTVAPPNDKPSPHP
jgi:hypothetical protein